MEEIRGGQDNLGNHWESAALSVNACGFRRGEIILRVLRLLGALQKKELGSGPDHPTGPETVEKVIINQCLLNRGKIILEMCLTG
jgi:hypothetical protein